MNAFFKCAELGRYAEFPLKVMSENFPMDNITLNQLDRSLVKDLAARQGNPGGLESGLKESAKSPEMPEVKNNKSEAPETPESKKIDAKAPEAENGQSGESKEPLDPEAKENREMTQDEINAKQREAIKDAFGRILRGEKLTNLEKGNLCEMLMDQYYISQGYTPLHKDRVTSLDDAGHHGLDGVYQKGDKYVIADAKYDRAEVNSKETQDGRQMSWDWINKRLDDAVGKEKADEIRQAREENPDNVVTQIYHFKPDADFENNRSACGSLYHVNEDGKKDGPEIAVEIYQDGERVELYYKGNGRLDQADEIRA